MRRGRVGLGGRSRGLIGTVARTAVVAGTASAVAGKVASNREARKHHQQAQVDQQVSASLAGQQPAAVQAAPEETASAGGLSAESIARLKQLSDLVKEGILTEDEFVAQKAKILGA